MGRVGGAAAVSPLASGPAGIAPESAALLRRAWGREPAVFPHHLVGLEGVPVSLAGLDGLLRQLPPAHVIIRRSALTAGGEMERIPRLEEGTSLEEFLSTTCAHVMVIDLQTLVPAYRALLDRFVGCMAPVVAGLGHGIVRPMVGLFLSSPASVAQFHADPENNFLVQVAGSKEVHVFPNHRPDVFAWTDREALFIRHKHRLPYKPEFESCASVCRLGPGMSSYQPALCPHWVLAGPDISISIGFSLFTTAERRKGRILTANAQMRRLGVHPSPPGDGALRDGMKACAGLALERARHLLRRR